jgi:hypothetical protein
MLGRVVSAQDEFRGFLRDLVSPAMRSAGLRGSAGRCYVPNLSCFALADFQKSEWSTGSAVNFTMNLKVVSREVWELAREDQSWLPETPAPNTRYPVAEWSPRIGSLMPEGKITGGGCGRDSNWSRWLLK